jgi:hypothetical protein
MGRQIEYYMELDSYKLLVKKAFELGFKVIEGQNNIKIYNCFDGIVFPKQHLYFYLEEAGNLIIKDNGYLDLFSSPLIESGFSFINANKKEITKSRLWVSSGSWLDNDTFIQRDKILDKRYSALVRFVKKLAPNTEVEVKSQNPMYDGKKFINKVYITPFLLEKINSSEYDCI